MKQIGLVLKKEWMSFVGSDRSLFVVYAVIIASWGMLIANWKDTGTPSLIPLWVAMFSVIVTATFSSTVFVSERVSGSLEIFLTCGISRAAILYGKMAFVFCMTMLVGAVCFGVAGLLKPLIAADRESLVLDFSGPALYASSSFLNAACGAYFSVLLPNPRILHLLNLLIVSIVMALHIVFPEITLYAASAIMAIGGVLFTALAKRQFDSERIIKPVIL